MAYLEVLPRYSQHKMISEWNNTTNVKAKRNSTKSNSKKIEIDTKNLLKVERRKAAGVIQLGVLTIPKIDLKLVVIEDATPKNLAIAPALIKGTAYPGTIGNACISGHRVTHGFPFRKIDQLTKGDKIMFANSSGSMTFTVKKKYKVLPNNLNVLKQTNYPQITLLSCDPPFSAKYRLAVIATNEDYDR